MGNKIHIRSTLLAGTFLLGMVPFTASAQTVSEEGAYEAEEAIVVTGIRRSLADAKEIKRNAEIIGDVISAEDIGKFPDQNLAESLQRITGVQITRSRGEGAAVSVRGLSPDFTRTQYNGRTIPSTTGARSFNFTSLTSDFVSSIQVAKTPTADAPEGGLSATINVTTARPLDVGKNRYAFTVEGLYESNPKKLTPHVSGIINHVFGDGTVGISAGASYEERKLLVFNYSAFGLENGVEASRNPPLDYNVDGDFGDSFRFNHAAGLGVADGNNKRLTAIGGIQIQATDTFQLYGDVFYSRFKEDFDDVGQTARFTNIAGPNAGIRGGMVDSNGILTFMDADGVDLRNNGRHKTNEDTTWSGAFGGKLVTDSWLVSTEFSYSKAKRLASTLGLEVLGRASVSQDLSIDPGGIANVEFTRGYNSLDPQNFNAVGFNGSYKAPTTDTNKDARVDITRKFDDGFVRAAKVGFFASDRTNAFRSANVRISARVLADALGVPYNSTIEGGSFNAASFMQHFSYPGALNNYNGPASMPTEFLTSTNGLLFDAISLRELLALAPPAADAARDFSVNEKVLAAYAKLDFASTDDRLTGNVGLRFVSTNQRSNGNAPDLSELIFTQQGAQTIIPNVTAVSIKNNYENWLPSLNIKYDVTDNLVARFGAARVLTRPNINLLSTSTNVNANVRTVTQFNPRLKPFLADQLDVSLEYYFGDTGLVSVAGFYKDLKNFIVNTTSTQDLTLSLAEGGGTVTFPFTFFRPENGTGGKLKGIEVGAQVPLSFLPSPFDGFGVMANYTYLDVGKLAVNDGGPKLPVPGVSKNSYNLTAYYEKGGFGFRVAYNYRSGFTVDQNSYFGDGDFGRSYGQLDASLNYDINKMVAVHLDATNINEAAVRNYDVYGISRGFEDVGRRVTGGVRVKF